MERSIHLCSELKGAIELLNASYAELGRIIQAEHEAIRVSDLDTLELITADKEIVGSRIAEAVQQVQGCLQLAHSLCDGEDAPSDVTALLGWLSARTLSAETSGLDHQVLTHLVGKARALFSEFTERKAAMQPKVEMNIMLVKKLLNHHRETFRFWQEIAREAQSTYQPDGKTKTTPSTSVLNVKA